MTTPGGRSNLQAATCASILYNQVKVLIILDTTLRVSESNTDFFFYQFIFVLQQGCGWSRQLCRLSYFILKFLINAVCRFFSPFKTRIWR